MLVILATTNITFTVGQT